MDKEDFAEFRKEVALAFKDRVPGTECLRVVRLLMRLPVEFQAEFGDEWRAVANPEAFFGPKHADDPEYLTAGAYMYLHLLMLTELGFDPETREIPVTEIIQDSLFEKGLALPQRDID